MSHDSAAARARESILQAINLPSASKGIAGLSDGAQRVLVLLDRLSRSRDASEVDQIELQLYGMAQSLLWIRAALLAESSGAGNDGR
jgi:hypothetical protein